MLLYWLPFILVLVLRAYRHRRALRLDDAGFVTIGVAAPPWRDRLLAAVTGRAALMVTGVFGLATVAVLVVGLAAVYGGTGAAPCLLP